ncbi:MAG: zinc ribbon domain-containing protein [Methanoregula sp.]
MAKKCERCGTPALNDLSEFCNRCGATIGSEPVNIQRTCAKCGAVPLDDDTLFCNRCGTPFDHQVSNVKPILTPVFKPAQQVSVKISKKKQAHAVEPQEDLWDTVPQEVITPGYFSYPAGQPPASSKKKYAHLPLVAEELSGGRVRDESIVIPGNSKKYAHLPLVTDEFKENKEKSSPRLSHRITPALPEEEGWQERVI